MSWRDEFKRLRALPDRFDTLIGRLRELTTELAKPVPPTVVFLGFGVVGEGRVLSVVGGDRVRLHDGLATHTLQFGTHRPVRNLQVVVFCDLDRVDVRNIFVGTDVLANSVDSGSPIAWKEELLPGILVRAMVQRRP